MFLLCVLCYLLFVILLFLLLIELYSILVTGHCVLLHLLVCTVFTLFLLFPILLNFFLQFTIFTMLFNTVHLRFTVFFLLFFTVHSPSGVGSSGESLYNRSGSKTGPISLWLGKDSLSPPVTSLGLAGPKHGRKDATWSWPCGGRQVALLGKGSSSVGWTDWTVLDRLLVGSSWRDFRCRTGVSRPATADAILLLLLPLVFFRLTIYLFKMAALPAAAFKPFNIWSKEEWTKKQETC